MSTIKDTTVTMGGLSTLGNELSGKPDGSLNDCDNVVIRQPGVLEPAPYLLKGEVPPTVSSSVNARFTPLYATADTVTPFVHVWGFGGPAAGAPPQAGDYRLSVYDLDGNVAYDYNSVTLGYNGAVDTFHLTPGDAQTSWSRNRRLCSTDRSVLTWTRNTADTNYELRQAGIPAPKGLSFIGITPGTPDITPFHPYVVAWRATIVRTYPNYSLESSVTPIVVRRSTSATTFKQISVSASFDSNLDIRAGDICVLYRTAFQSDPLGDTDPGDDMQEATRATITAADLTAGFIRLDDKSFNSSLAASLYTSKEGLAQNNYPPPNAHDVCTFGDTTFYSLTQDYPIMSFQMPNVGNYADGASVGQGNFTVTTAVLNATTGTIVGDQTAFILPGMVVFVNSLFAVVATVSYNGGTGLTTVTLTSGGFSGYVGYYNKPAGALLVTFSDTWTFTYNEYDGSTSRTIFVVNAGNADAVYGMPSESLLLTAPGTSAGLQRIAISSWSVTPNTGSPTFSIVASVKMTRPAGFRSFSMVATHGNGYASMDSYTTVGNTAFKASVQSTDKATLYYSKSQLPESVPAGNYFPVGHGEIQRLFADQNSLYAACTDGLYRITGVGNDWTVVLLSKTFRLVSKNAVTQCLGTPFVWGQDGISAINESGPKNVSNQAVGPALSRASTLFSPAYPHDPYEWLPCMTGDDARQEVTLQLDTTKVFLSAVDATENIDNGGLLVLNLTSLAFYYRSQVIANARAYQPKWKSTFLFTFNRPVATILKPSIAWEERPAELQLSSSFYPTNGRTAVRVYPSRVYWIFNPFKDQASVLKQWIDCNILIRKNVLSDVFFEVGPDAGGEWYTFILGTQANSYLRFFFSYDELFAPGPPTSLYNWNYATTTSLPRQHGLMPRRVAVADELFIGVELRPSVYTLPTQATLVSTTSYPRFYCEGFTLRYRVSSDTFQV